MSEEKKPMQQHIRWPAVLLVIAPFGLSACAQSLALDSEAASNAGPARVEAITGTDLSRVHLTPQAARRLDVQTATVQLAPVSRGARAAQARQKTIPYAALLYDAQGAAFTYTSPAPLTYVRSPVSVRRITGRTAVLTKGPAAGTRVVTVGAAELVGTEYGVEQ
jgi:hypothetical protein